MTEFDFWTDELPGYLEPDGRKDDSINVPMEEFYKNICYGDIIDLILNGHLKRCLVIGLVNRCPYNQKVESLKLNIKANHEFIDSAKCLLEPDCIGYLQYIIEGDAGIEESCVVDHCSKSVNFYPVDCLHF